MTETKPPVSPPVSPPVTASTTPPVAEDNAPKFIDCEVIGDTPVDGVYKGGIVTLYPETAKAWVELELVKEVKSAN